MEKLGVACYGLRGHQILGELAGHPRARLVAVAEIPEDQFAERLGAEETKKVRCADSLEELIDAPDVDLISLCSPRRDQQCRHAIQCLEGGKHVLAEKPCAMTVKELEELQRVMARCSAQFRQMAGIVQYPILKALRTIVEAGEIGDVVQVYAMKSYPYHDRRPQDRGIDGGLIRQAGIHGIRAIQGVTGLRAKRVVGFDTTYANPGDGELQMSASVAMEMDNGATGVLVCNYLNPRGIGYHGNDQVRAHGMKGLAEAVDGFTRRRVFIAEKGERSLDEFDLDAPHPSFFSQYVDLLLDGTPIPESLDDDLWATRTVCRAQQAVDEGRILEV